MKTDFKNMRSRPCLSHSKANLYNKMCVHVNAMSPITIWTVEVEVKADFVIQAKEYYAPGKTIPNESNDTIWMVRSKSLTSNIHVTDKSIVVECEYYQENSVFCVRGRKNRFLRIVKRRLSSREIGAIYCVVQPYHSKCCGDVHQQLITHAEMRELKSSIQTETYKKRVERKLREVKITKKDNSAFTEEDEKKIFYPANDGGELFLAARYDVVNKKRAIFAYNLQEHGFGAQNTTMSSKAQFALRGFDIVPPNVAFPSQGWQQQVYKDLGIPMPKLQSLKQAVIDSEKSKDSPLLSARQDGPNDWHPDQWQSHDRHRNMSGAFQDRSPSYQSGNAFQTPQSVRGKGAGKGKGSFWTHQTRWDDNRGKGRGGYDAPYSDGGFGYGQDWPRNGNGWDERSDNGSYNGGMSNFSHEVYGQTRGRSRSRGSYSDSRKSNRKSRSRDGGDNTYRYSESEA